MAGFPMKVVMLAGLSGPGLSLSEGDEAEFSDPEAERLIAAGIAAPAASAPPSRRQRRAERAVAPSVGVERAIEADSTS
jgi:hypothetical protein